MDTQLKPKFEKFDDGLVPVIIQDQSSKVVLMLGYMNQEAFDQTVGTGKVCFYSRSKSRLWVKGETSGNFLVPVSFSLDCDSDALLIVVEPNGPVCHTGAFSCFGQEQKPDSIAFLTRLETIIAERQAANSDEKSYVAGLFRKGINKIAQKVGEEAVEVVIEAKDNDPDLFRNEAADLLFHYLILLRAKGSDLAEISRVLQNRHSLK